MRVPRLYNPENPTETAPFGRMEGSGVGAPARRSERKPVRSWAPKAVLFSSECRAPVTLPYPTSLARSPGPRFPPGHRFRGAGRARRDGHPGRQYRSRSQERHGCLGAGSSSTPTCVIVSPCMSRTISSTAPKRVRSPMDGLPSNLLAKNSARVIAPFTSMLDPATAIAQAKLCAARSPPTSAEPPRRESV
jgi:hypothetical protein